MDSQVETNAWRRMTMLLLSAIITTGTGLLFRHYFRLDYGYIIAGGAVAFVLLYFFLQQLWEMSVKTVRAFTRMLEKTSTQDIVGGTLGLLVGVLLGMLSSVSLHTVPFVGPYLAVLFFILFSYFGLKIGVARAGELLQGPLFIRKKAEGKKNSATAPTGKIVDTSAIIDGRIQDVALSGFLEGRLLVPQFVIEELQHIADSEDSVRRAKGRRGLDILAQMQKEEGIAVEILDEPVEEEREVDMKLLRLCHKFQAAIITNDYNLNKVADLQGIKVLNIHELVNALKVVVHPGETFPLHIMKAGKEARQGVGYLEDGTMVVVEDGKSLVGKTVEVTVTSVFQTAAGRMIFTRRNKDGRVVPMLTEKAGAQG